MTRVIRADEVQVGDQLTDPATGTVSTVASIAEREDPGRVPARTLYLRTKAWGWIARVPGEHVTVA